MHAHNFKDLTGQRFGKRQVISFHSVAIYRGKRGSSRWLVRCDCGRESILQTSAVKIGKTCGCDESYAARSGATRKSPVPRNVRSNHGHRLRRFGLSQEAFENMQKSQNGSCAICESPFERTPHVDHDHACCAGIKSCGKCVRGLLCHHCNTGLGNFKDRADFLLKAVQYLQKEK
jgi:hypothetical protein